MVQRQERRNGLRKDILIMSFLTGKQSVLNAKGLEAEELDQQKNFSALKALKSKSGWYIGRTYTDPITQCNEPGSRDSGYFKSEKEALNYLAEM